MILILPENLVRNFNCELQYVAPIPEDCVSKNLTWRSIFSGIRMSSSSKKLTYSPLDALKPVFRAAEPFLLTL